LKTVWITGTGGLIGSHLVRCAPSFAPNFRIISLARQDLDLTDFAAVEKRFRADQPDLIIHCAAMSKTVDCQNQPALARKINVDSVAQLAELASGKNFIFFSTDLVFDGRKGHYAETDEVNPLNAYGQTKVAAEEVVRRNPRHTIVRLALCMGRTPRGNQAFNEDLAAQWRAGKTPRLFHDEFRTPMIAPVAARAIWELAESGQGGLYHLGGAERMSRARMGELVAARHPELNPRVETCSLREYQGPPRSADTSLNSAKIQALLSFPLPGLSAWLNENPNGEI